MRLGPPALAALAARALRGRLLSELAAIEPRCSCSRLLLACLLFRQQMHQQSLGSCCLHSATKCCLMAAMSTLSSYTGWQ